MLCGRQGATHLKPKKRPGSAKGFTKARGTPTGRRSRSCKGSKPLFIIFFYRPFTSDPSCRGTAPKGCPARYETKLQPQMSGPGR